MMVLWVTLFILHRAYTLIPVTAVQLGEPVTFTCVLPKSDLSRRVHWYKQSTGDDLKFIWTVKESAAPEFAPEFSDSRWKVNYTKNVCNLTILETNQEDEGIYHCGITQWLKNTKWTGTYLLVKGNTQRTSNYTVIQEKIVPPGDLVTLRCSVLSDSDSKTCPSGLRLFWFRGGSHPNIIYTDGNRHHECKKRSETEQGCVYQFSKTINLSDEGTYYCAVATCGKILFGNGTKLDIQGSSVWSQTVGTVIFLLCPVLVLIIIAVFIYMIKKINNDHYKAAVLEKNRSDLKRQQNKDTWMFSAVVFTTMKADRDQIKDAKAVKRQQIYTAIKTFGLD